MVAAFPPGGNSGVDDADRLAAFCEADKEKPAPNRVSNDQLARFYSGVIGVVVDTGQGVHENSQCFFE